MPTTDSTKRFSSRVENYIKYRPGYPPEIIRLLRTGCGLSPASVVADVGSGTGLLTRLFLENGNTVFGVEPNPDMRAAGERLLGGFPRFKSVVGTAEATTLGDASVDFIVAGQAFHWFDREQARREFVRILKPAGWVVLIWNDRKTSSKPLLQDYERLLNTFASDYSAVNHSNVDPDAIQDFFNPGTFKLASFPNQQVFNFEGLFGRLMSSSYAPEPGNPKHEPMVTELASLFQTYERNGTVSFEYDTLVYYGQLPAR
jgi:SAM-dependent methyltransferase